MIENKTKIIVSGVGGMIISYYNSINIVAQVLIVLVMIDFVWGLLIAGIDKKIKSKTAYKGLLKKASYLIIIYLGYGLDLILKQTIFANLIMVYLVVIECISILEHMDKLDVRYPKFMRIVLDKLMVDIDKGQLSDDWKPDPNTTEEGRNKI